MARVGAAALIVPALVLLYSAPGAAEAVAKQGVDPVTCGSTVKLSHATTKYRLHSHEITYGSGSGQQSVTGFPEGHDSNSYWEIHSPLKRGPQAYEVEHCLQGTPLKDGDLLRLRHGATGRWLHSHNHQSPMSGQQEVSCFGGDAESNTADNWRVEIEGGGEWKRNKKVRLAHVDTGVYLGSHDKKFGRPIAGQQEVFGARRKGPETFWTTAEGVFFPQRTDL
mmetsp:Transcript_1857/g.6461  ORF Transcript_1857/g.6461 Transcript_1857/m.6461 type:complete len:223 (+) Transcript_1857:56-724(+)